jgi:BTB/POZ domain
MVTERNDSTIADIASDGDVILVVGAGMKRLKAYSLVLKSASKVFSAMLGPKFSEGQRLDENESTEIDMPEDDAEAMEIMLNVIHGRNNAVHDGLDASQILRVAITE